MSLLQGQQLHAISKADQPKFWNPKLCSNLSFSQACLIVPLSHPPACHEGGREIFPPYCRHLPAQARGQTQVEVIYHPCRRPSAQNTFRAVSRNYVQSNCHALFGSDLFGEARDVPHASRHDVYCVEKVDFATIFTLRVSTTNKQQPLDEFEHATRK